MPEPDSAPFRTVEVSDPAFEFGNLRFVTVQSKSLGRRADLCVASPPGADSPLPLVILLHGVYGSHWAWALRGGAHVTAQRLIEHGDIRPLVLAMPSDGLWGDGSGYLEHSGSDPERWILGEVPAAAALAGPVDDSSPVYLCGLSMGGYGALRLGARSGACVAGVSAHSSITEFAQLADFVHEPLPIPSAGSGELDAIHSLRTARSLPPIRFDCGREDPLLEGNRRLHRQLEDAGIEHQYEEFTGAHEWAYWARHLEDSLRFFDSLRDA